MADSVASLTCLSHQHKIGLLWNSELNGLCWHPPSNPIRNFWMNWWQDSFQASSKIPKSTQLPTVVKQASYILLQCTDVRLKLTIHDKIPLYHLWKVFSRPHRVLEHTWCIPQESKHNRFLSVLTISWHPMSCGPRMCPNRINVF